MRSLPPLANLTSSSQVTFDVFLGNLIQKLCPFFKGEPCSSTIRNSSG